MQTSSHSTQCAGRMDLTLNLFPPVARPMLGADNSDFWVWWEGRQLRTHPVVVLEVGPCGSRGFKFPGVPSASLSHQTSHTKEKFKDKIIRKFKKVTTGYLLPSIGPPSEFGVL